LTRWERRSAQPAILNGSTHAVATRAASRTGHGLACVSHVNVGVRHLGFEARGETLFAVVRGPSSLHRGWWRRSAIAATCSIAVSLLMLAGIRMFGSPRGDVSPLDLALVFDATRLRRDGGGNRRNTREVRRRRCSRSWVGLHRWVSRACTRVGVAGYTTSSGSFGAVPFKPTLGTALNSRSTARRHRALAPACLGATGDFTPRIRLIASGRCGACLIRAPAGRLSRCDGAGAGTSDNRARRSVVEQERLVGSRWQPRHEQKSACPGDDVHANNSSIRRNAFSRWPRSRRVSRVHLQPQGNKGRHEPYLATVEHRR